MNYLVGSLDYLIKPEDTTEYQISYESLNTEVSMSSDSSYQNLLNPNAIMTSEDEDKFRSSPINGFLLGAPSSM